MDSRDLTTVCNTYFVWAVNGCNHFRVALLQVRAAVRLTEHTHLTPYPAQLVGPTTVCPKSLLTQQIHRFVDLPMDRVVGNRNGRFPLPIRYHVCEDSSHPRCRENRFERYRSLIRR